METISGFLCDDHRACDADFGAAEAAVARGAWTLAEGHFAAFRRRLECHLAREEEILFPPFEARTGQPAGPTAVMRAEHGRIRELHAALTERIGARDRDAFLAHADTLFTLIQQHNLKEEQVLYPAIDLVLQDERAALLDAMRRLAQTSGARGAA